MSWSYNLWKKNTKPLTWERYDELVKDFWKSFSDYWSKKPFLWPPTPWLPAHDFPKEPLEIGVPTRIKQLKEKLARLEND